MVKGSWINLSRFVWFLFSFLQSIKMAGGLLPKKVCPLKKAGVCDPEA
jgi:hypothetical protein